jgi:hypothetical protein
MHKLKGMARATVHVVITVRDATVQEEVQNSMNTLGVLRKIVLRKRQMMPADGVYAVVEVW